MDLSSSDKEAGRGLVNGPLCTAGNTYETNPTILYVWVFNCRLTQRSQIQRTVSSLLHSTASPAVFGAAPWCWRSVMAATFCSSLHTCSRYFLRICLYEFKALLQQWTKQSELFWISLVAEKIHTQKTILLHIYLWACARRAIWSPLSFLCEELSGRTVFIESWTKANLFFRACSLKCRTFKTSAISTYCRYVISDSEYSTFAELPGDLSGWVWSEPQHRLHLWHQTSET